MVLVAAIIAASPAPAYALSTQVDTSLPAGARDTRPIVTAQPPSGDAEVARHDLDPGSAPTLSNAEMAKLVRDKIKYVFVIFNENESFDHEYGTFPGADGLYSDGRAPRSAADTPGFVQRYTDAAGVEHRVTPFRMGPAQNADVMDSVDHSHIGLAHKLAVEHGLARMSGFAQVEYDGKAGSAITPAVDARGKQFANLVMSYIDCDTIPFFWRYADRFVLFDRIFATEDTPSTPNAVAMLAGQSGETQWVRHGAAGVTLPLVGTINGVTYDGRIGTTQGPPLVNDPQPFWGSEFDRTREGRQPTSPAEFYGPRNIASNMTAASVLLTLGGKDVGGLLSGDRHPAMNQADIGRDIPFITATGKFAVRWGWYQNGYDHEPYDIGMQASHVGYVAHHNGAQYFGYIADNPTESGAMHGEGDFFSDVAADRLPREGGVFYIRGGYRNLQGLRASVTNRQFPRTAQASGGLSDRDVATIQAVKAGDDDHPSYAARGITEAMNARVINAIASNPELWAQSAIVITYDESDGYYDHVPPRILSYGPDGLPLSRGVRVPLLLISPYARTHVVSHAEGDHNAVIETINAIFDLPPLSTLPDEADALAAGDSPAFNRFAEPYGPAGFAQRFLGPRDTNSPITDSLLSGFDPRRLRGNAPPLPASYALIPNDLVNHLPHYGARGCKAVGIVPEDVRQAISAPPPAHFNSLPAVLAQYNFPAPP